MNKMKRVRKALGMTQVEMAKALGVKQSTISMTESGGIPISRKTSLALDALRTKHMRK